VSCSNLVGVHTDPFEGLFCIFKLSGDVGEVVVSVIGHVNFGGDPCFTGGEGVLGEKFSLSNVPVSDE